MSRLIQAILVLFLFSAGAFAAEFRIINNDLAGEGLNSTAAFTPVGNNPATTLGDARRVAIEYALNRLGRRLVSAPPIHVDVRFRNLGSSSLLGVGAPTKFFKDFPGAERPGINYPAALANALAGYDLEPDNREIVFIINSQVDFYLGLDGQGALARPDLVTAVLHEVIHGLGFGTNAANSTGEWQFGAPDIFSAHLKNLKTGVRFVDMPPAERRSTNDLGFFGTFTSDYFPRGADMSGNAHFKNCYSAVRPCSRYLLNRSATIPFTTNFWRQHDLGPEIGVLRDLGWVLEGFRSMNAVVLMQDSWFTRLNSNDNTDAAVFLSTILAGAGANLSVAGYQNFPDADWGTATERPFRIFEPGSPDPADVRTGLNQLFDTSISVFPFRSGVEGLFQTITGKGLAYATQDYSDPNEIRPSTLTDADFNVVINMYIPGFNESPDTSSNYPTADIEPFAARWADVDLAAGAKHDSLFLINVALPLLPFKQQAKSDADDERARLENVVSIADGVFFDVDDPAMEQIVRERIDAIRAELDAQVQDSDADTVADMDDNCPNNANTQQRDTNFDGIGDACDTAHPGFCSGIRSTEGDLSVAARAVIGAYDARTQTFSAQGTVRAGGDLSVHKNADFQLTGSQNSATGTDAVPTPEHLVSGGDLVVDHLETVTLEEGIYLFDNIRIKSNARLETHGTVIIWFTGSLTLDSNTTLTTTEDLANALTFYSTDTSGPVTIHSNSHFKGQIYAPNVPFNLRSHSQYFGNLVAHDIVIDANTEFFIESIDCE